METEKELLYWAIPFKEFDSKILADQIKFDFLGLRTLTVIDKAVKSINKSF